MDVRIIVDGFSNPDLQTQWMYFDLKQHGIEVQGYEALYLEWINELPMPTISPSRDPATPDSRYHEKLWIIDGETGHGEAVVGGLNIANEYFRINPWNVDKFWRDQDVIVKGTVVDDITATFDRNFDHFQEIKKSRGILNTDIYWHETQNLLDSFGKITVRFNTDTKLTEHVEKIARTRPALEYERARCRFFHNRPRLGESYIREAYTKLIGSAVREILICNAYFIPSPEFIRSIKAAVRRGVNVIILTNSPGTNDLPELTMVGRSYYKNILAVNDEEASKNSGARVQIWEWHGQRCDGVKRTEGTLHAKYAVVDRQFALVGSYNLDPRSEKLNSETALVFENKALSTKLARLFYENDLCFSRRITLEDAREFSDPSDVLYKIRETFGSLFESEL